jgi:hypothetical protein
VRNSIRNITQKTVVSIAMEKQIEYLDKFDFISYFVYGVKVQLYFRKICDSLKVVYYVFG